MNDTQLLERLVAAYATLDAPAPSAALAALMDVGGVAEPRRRRRPARRGRRAVRTAPVTHAHALPRRRAGRELRRA